MSKLVTAVALVLALTAGQFSPAQAQTRCWQSGNQTYCQDGGGWPNTRCVTIGSNTYCN